MWVLTDPDGPQHALHGRVRSDLQNQRISVQSKLALAYNNCYHWTHRKILHSKSYQMRNEPGPFKTSSAGFVGQFSQENEIVKRL